MKNYGEYRGPDGSATSLPTAGKSPREIPSHEFLDSQASAKGRWLAVSNGGMSR
jgi:hypothetical protein